MIKKISLVIAFAAISGCATQTFEINGGGALAPDEEKMQSFFVSGLGQTQEMDAAEICGGADKVAKVESHLNFIDGFLGALTYGIYTPRTAKVYCTQ